MRSAPLLHVSALSAFPGVVHGFTTREGGVSEGSLASLNLANRAHERPEHLAENWDRVARGLHPAWSSARVALLTQVHGAVVRVITEPTGPHAVAGDADAAVTKVPGVILAVRVADCVPVLLAAPGGVGVAHAGWRGVVAGVVPRTVEALCALTGASPAQLVAAIGPHISGDQFETGPEVVEGLTAAGLDPARFVVARRPKAFVDLGVAVEDQLRAAGVRVVEQLRACSVLDPRFYSHRRGGPDTGRMAGVIARLS